MPCFQLVANMHISNNPSNIKHQALTSSVDQVSYPDQVCPFTNEGMEVHRG